MRLQMSNLPNILIEQHSHNLNLILQNNSLIRNTAFSVLYFIKQFHSHSSYVYSRILELTIFLLSYLWNGWHCLNPCMIPFRCPSKEYYEHTYSQIVRIFSLPQQGRNLSRETPGHLSKRGLERVASGIWLARGF